MWVNITTGSIRTVLSDAEYNKFTTLLTGSYMTPDSIVSTTISEVTNLIRGYIAASNKNEVHSDATLIPDSLLHPALSILAVRLPQRIGGKVVDLSGYREKEYDRAFEILDLVASGKFAVEKPPTVTSYTEKDTVLAGCDNAPLIY